MTCINSISSRRLLIAILVVTFVCRVSIAQDKPTNSFSEELYRFGKSCNIEIVVTNQPFVVEISDRQLQGDAPNKDNLKLFEPLLAQELSFYPPKIVAWSGLRRIVMCENLSYAGRKYASLTRRSRHEVLFDIGVGLSEKQWKRVSVHHEFFHLFDYRMQASFDVSDERWSALNPGDFRYGLNAVHEGAGIVTDRYPGFLNNYSRTSAAEDKAELFGYLMVDSPYLEERSKSDAVLRAKARRIKEMLRASYPEFNDEFWKNSRRVHPAN